MTPAAAVGAAAPPPRQPWLRLVLAVSLDGRLAPAGGGAAQLGGRGDRRALEEALAWADATLVGAETLRRHRSHCLIHHGDLLSRRQAERRPPQPIAIVVSRCAALPADLPFFHQPLQGLADFLLVAARFGLDSETDDRLGKVLHGGAHYRAAGGLDERFGDRL